MAVSSYCLAPGAAVAAKTEESQVRPKWIARRLRRNARVRAWVVEKALLQRYTKQLDGQEDRLAALQKEAANRKAKRDQLQSELDAMVMKLTIDETL